MFRLTFKFTFSYQAINMYESIDFLLNFFTKTHLALRALNDLLLHQLIDFSGGSIDLAIKLIQRLVIKVCETPNFLKKSIDFSGECQTPNLFKDCGEKKENAGT